MIDSEGFSTLPPAALAITAAIIEAPAERTSEPLLSFFLRRFVPMVLSGCDDPLGASSSELETLSLMIGASVMTIRAGDAARRSVEVALRESYLSDGDVGVDLGDSIDSLVAELIEWLESPKSRLVQTVLLQKLRSRPAHAGHFILGAHK